MKNQMDLAMNIAIGSSIQIALFVAPVLVFASYFMRHGPMDLRFTPFEVLAVVDRGRGREPGGAGRRVELARGRAAARGLRDARHRVLLPAVRPELMPNQEDRAMTRERLAPPPFPRAALVLLRVGAAAAAPLHGAPPSGARSPARNLDRRRHRERRQCPARAALGAGAGWPLRAARSRQPDVVARRPQLPFQRHRVLPRPDSTRCDATWFDNTGNTRPIVATATPVALLSDWGTPATEVGRTHYQIQPDSSLSVLDSVRTRQAVWREFGRVTLRRKP